MPPVPRRLAQLLALAAGVTAAGAWLGASPQAPGSAAASARPNVVLVTLDTTRADHLGCYGGRFARTPNLDALAARGVRFARVDTAAPVTLPSHASILTGLVPPRHGVRDNGGFRLEERFETLAERLAAAGYDTGAAVSAAVISRPYGLAQGFRRWDEAFAGPGEPPAQERDAAAATDAALATLAELTPPFFLWVHYYDPHLPYDAPPRLLVGQSGLHRTYDAEIAHLDAELGRLLAALPAATVVLAVGDHGEMLGEHGEDAHGVLLHAGARRVPLLAAGPGVPAGRVVEPLVRTVDVAPTLAALAGVAWPAGGDGADLAPLWRGGGGEAGRLAYGESFLPLYSFRWYPPRALSDGRWLYLETPAARLYDLAADPGERADLAASRPSEVRRWGETLAALKAAWGEEGSAPPAAAAMPEEERRRLAALGYLAGSGRVDDVAALPDGTGLVDLANRLPAIDEAIDAGRCPPETLAELRGFVRRSRDTVPALILAGLCLTLGEQWAEALPFFQRAAAVEPRDATARANLAGCLLRLGRTAEAEAAYRETLALDPAQAESAANLARLLRERGDPGGAAAILDRAVAAGGAGGGDPRIRLERGLVRAEQGRLADALADFLAAAGAPAGPGATPDLRAAALEDAAQAAYRLGRPAQAADLYRRLAGLRPELPGPWKTLGALLLHELGDPAGARDAFTRALAVENDPAERAQLAAALAELGGR